jgi:hypothetical protein
MEAFCTQERGDAVTRSLPALHRNPNRRTARLSLLSAGVLLFGCGPKAGSPPPSDVTDPGQRKDIEIVSLTEISGAVNGAAVDARVSATINTGRGGTTSCQFERLPDRFTPATFGTHA